MLPWSFTVDDLWIYTTVEFHCGWYYLMNLVTVKFHCRWSHAINLYYCGVSLWMIQCYECVLLWSFYCGWKHLMNLCYCEVSLWIIHYIMLQWTVTVDDKLLWRWPATSVHGHIPTKPWSDWWYCVFCTTGGAHCSRTIFSALEWQENYLLWVTITGVIYHGNSMQII